MIPHPRPLSPLWRGVPKVATCGVNVSGETRKPKMMRNEKLTDHSGVQGIILKTMRRNKKFGIVPLYRPSTCCGEGKRVRH